MRAWREKNVGIEQIWLKWLHGEGGGLWGVIRSRVQPSQRLKLKSFILSWNVFDMSQIFLEVFAYGF